MNFMGSLVADPQMQELMAQQANPLAQGGIWCCYRMILYPATGAVGGLLGASIFKKDGAPPAAGGGAPPAGGGFGGPPPAGGGFGGPPPAGGGGGFGGPPPSGGGGGWQ